MPQPIPGQDAIDVGGGIAATRYDDGSVIFWNISTGQGVAQTPPGGSEAADLGNGNAASVGPDGRIQVWNISSGGAVIAPPGQSPATASGAVTAAASGAPQAAAGAGAGGFQALPGYAQFAIDQKAGYIPGNKDYNQWKLDTPGLFNAQGANLQYGSGSIGDPTNGTGPQSPQQWVQGGQLFVGNGQNLEGDYGILGNLFGRSDTPSGLGTPEPPKYALDILMKAIAEGRLTPTARGQEYLTQVMGVAPATYGNKVAAPTQGAGAAGSGGAAGGVFNFAAQAAEDTHADMAAKTAYQRWLISSGDEKLAFDKAKEAYSEAIGAAALTGQYNGQQTQAAQQQQFSQGLAAAGVTGMYNGQQTLAARQADQSQANTLLSLGATLRGPADWATYARTMGNTPGGLRDSVNALAGRYGIASTAGATPGSQYQRASVGSLVNDINGAAPGGAVAGGTDLSGIPLPSGNQWNPQAYNTLAANPTQAGMLQGLYQESGRDWNTELANYKASLPKYGGATQAAYKF